MEFFKMTYVSWISVCAFVMAAAISLSKRSDVQEDVRGSYVFTTKVVSSTKHGADADLVRGSLHQEGGHVADSATIRKTTPEDEQFKNNVLACRNRLENVTSDFHMNMRKIYRHYKPRVNDSNNSVISAVQRYLEKNVPSFKFRNKTLSKNKNVTMGLLEERARIIQNESIDQGNTDQRNTIQNNTNHENNITAGEMHTRKPKIALQRDKTKGTDTSVEFAVNSNNTVESLTSQVTQVTSNNEGVNLESFMSCEHVAGLQDPRWLKMIALCPTHWADINIRAQCEEWDNLNTQTFVDDATFLPVQDVNGTVYANVYCAVCHKVDWFVPWTTSFACDNKDPPQTLQKLLLTDMSSLSSYIMLSKCQRKIQPSFPEAIQKCAKGSLQPRRRPNTFVEAITSSYPVSFSVLMNFDFTGQTHLLFSAAQTVIQEEYKLRCGESQTYDPYYQNCRQITCSRSYTLIAGICVPTGEDPTSGESITNISQLRTVNIVSLLVNITFGDFLMIKFTNTELDIVPQIAEHLNISTHRIKDVNITFELGSINGSALEVTTFTEDEYKNLFPPLQSQNATQRWTAYAEESSKSQGAFSVPVKSEPSGKEMDTAPGYMPQNSNGSHGNAESANFNFSATLISPMKAAELRKKFKLQDANETSQVSEGSSANHVVKDSGQSHSSFNLFNKMHSNASISSTYINKKLWKQAIKHGEMLVSTHYENFFRYHFRSPDNETDLYVSAPINDQNDRVVLLMRNSLSLRPLLEQSMVMRISFALVPSDDPQPDEIGANKLLQMIDNLIYEQQFSLKVNGNKVDVVAMDDDREEVKNEQEFCPWGIEYMVYDGEFMIIYENNVTLMYVNKTNSYVEVGKFDLYVFLSGNNDAVQTNFTSMMSYAFVCFMPRIIQKECKQIRLTKDEYFVAGENKSIVFEEKLYDIFSYQVLDEKTGEINICMPPDFNNQEIALLPQVLTIDSGCSDDFDGALGAEGYMTLVLGRVSCVALSCVIVTYLLFSKLRNLPGLNTLNLTFSLLVTQIIFAEGIGEKRQWLCSMVAISLHYTLLAAHFWMNVMSYDVYKTFTNPVLCLVREKKKYFPRYALYAWGAPFVIVSFCAFIDFSHLFNGVSIGYGNVESSSTDLNLSYYNYTNVDVANSSYISSIDQGQIHPCWITQPLAALVAFGSIILTIFMANCIFFGKTIVSISRTTKITKKSLTTRHSNSSFQKVADSSEVMLYLKMASVMGFTWIFGLSSSILSSFARPVTYTACMVVHVLTLLFIIFNTSQGIFIFIAFVCNRRVFSLYKDFLRKIKTYIVLKRRGSIFSVSSGVSFSRRSQQS